MWTAFLLVHFGIGGYDLPSTFFFVPVKQASSEGVELPRQLTLHAIAAAVRLGHIGGWKWFCPDCEERDHQ
jgi:hypothetical protein